MRLAIVVNSALSAILINGRVITNIDSISQYSTHPRDDVAWPAPIVDITTVSGGLHATGPAWAVPPTEERPMYVPYPPASNDYWEKVKCKGHAFYQAMHGSDVEAGKLFAPARATAESSFTDAGNELLLSAKI
jgi:hypothetical protein